MKYIIAMMSGEKFRISPENYKKLEGRQGLIYIPEIQCTINLSSVSSIYPESKADEIENRREQKTGVLHDGTRVIRHFGEWVVANEQYPDDNGQYQRIKLDPTYYPEIAADKVATEAEWKQVQKVGDYARITGFNIHEKRTSTGGFTQLLE